ncbi:MAG: D-alanine--D-alanine ligase [Alphaproteobacteria bacterium]
MAKDIIVLLGGKSAEREVSLVSGEACAVALESKGHKVRRVDPNSDLADWVKLLIPKPDVVFNALHGQYGEDGRVQGVLDLLGIPYTHSGVAASALAMDKVRAKKILQTVGMPVAKDKSYTLDALKTLDKDPFERPFVLKPLSEGSSVGVYIFAENKNISVQDVANQESSELWMAEEFLCGKELTVAVRDGEALAVTEIKPSTEFYDFEAKYTDGITQHILPATVDKSVETEVKRLAVLAHETLGCRGISRSDFKLDQHGKPVYLETNTQPGMTPLSLVPEQAQFIGIDFADLVDWIVDSAVCDA